MPRSIRTQPMGGAPPPPSAGPSRAPGMRTRRGSHWFNPWVIVTGGLLVVLGVLVLLPVGMLGLGSLRDAAPGAEGNWTFAAWRSAYTDPRTYSTLASTLLVTIGAVGLSAPLALFLAWAVTRTDTPGRGLLERLLLAPLFVPGVLIALSWTILGSPRTGLVNRLVRLIPGFEWFTVDVYSWYGLVFIFALAVTPLMYFLLLPVLKTMDRTLEEAAEISGAGRFRTATKITLPLIAPAILSGAILVAVKAIENLEVPAILRSGSGIDVFMTRIFFSIRSTPTPDYALAAALGSVVLILTGLLVLWQQKYVTKRDFVTIGSRGTKLEITRLGPWRYVTALGCWGYLSLAVLLPLAVLGFGSFETFFGMGDIERLTLRHWSEVVNDSTFWLALRNTLMTAIGASVLVTSLSAAIGYVVVRSHLRARWALEGASWVAWGIPGPVLGLGLLWTYAMLPGGLYLSRWVLIVAYSTILLPLGVRLFTSGFRQLNTELEEAAAVSGSGPVRRASRVIAPLLSKTISTSLLLGFVMSVREVGMPAILATRNTEVLGSLTLSAWLEGRASYAAVTGIVMIALSGAALALQAAVDYLIERQQSRDRVGSGVLNGPEAARSVHGEHRAEGKRAEGGRRL